MKKSRSPWVDKSELIKDIKDFIEKSGGFFRQNANRMSDFFEMAAYNSIVTFYKEKGYGIQPVNLKKGIFRYKLSPSGIAENFSYFIAQKDGYDAVEIHHNLKVESAHENHIYYTPDISVCWNKGAITVTQKNKRRHSYIPKDKAISFFETKHHNPFPELLFNFSGLVLEIMPGLIEKKLKCCSIDDGNRDCDSGHLTPGIIISGILNDYTKKIRDSLMQRYKYNIFTGTYRHRGKIKSFTDAYQRCFAKKCPFLNAKRIVEHA